MVEEMGWCLQEVDSHLEEWSQVGRKHLVSESEEHDQLVASGIQSLLFRSMAFQR